MEKEEIKIMARMAVVRWFNGRCICLGSMRFCLDGAQGRAGKCIQ